MKVNIQNQQILFQKYKLTSQNQHTQKVKYSYEQMLSQIIEIGHSIFEDRKQDQLNFQQNEGLKSKATNQFNINLNQGFNLKQLKKNMQSSKKNKIPKCYSERYSESEKSDIFNLKEDDWISEDNNYQKQSLNQFINKKQKNPEKGSFHKNENKNHQIIKISDHLLKPVKNFKKKTLKDIQQLKKKEQLELLAIQTKNKSNLSLSQFYHQNNKHLPIYEKAQASQMNKRKNVEQRIIQKSQNQMKEVTFKPKITKIAQNINKNFQQRMVQNKKQKQLKQQKIIIEQLKKCPFNPKINKKLKNKNIQSRVKSIWTSENSSFIHQKCSQHQNQFLNQNSKFFDTRNQNILMNSFKISKEDIPLFQQFMGQ